ncbi:ParB/RepB/Spo0J family partition protein [Eubacterium sp. MSJ-13]|uniref:ParB/RepB/Spo0J family partition protein n=1 Tax=Eubacterium sp. MSJ-13 TaxID=2841513 RepID=UPI001C0FB670|nr:ParB/RepB/Spo0J family partition protein [Eubacterium sp. MSJ-13]
MKKGLGKGIDVLIPQAKEKTKSEKENITTKEIVKEVIKEVVKEVDTIDINKIEPNKNQPRKSFDEDSIHELAESIRQRGIIQPLVVQKAEKGLYTIIAGERRWRAAKIAGLKDIPVVVKNYSNQDIMEIALIENIQREDLNPIEEAEAYEQLIKEYNLKQDEVADKVAKSRVAITNSLRLLKLDERVRRMVIEEKLKSGHARTLIPIEDGNLQYELAQKIFDEKLSVRETEKLVKSILNGKTAKKQNKKEINPQEEIIYKKYEENLKMTFGTKVNINRKSKDKGRIEIEYYSQSEFERILELINGIKNESEVN